LPLKTKLQQRGFARPVRGKSAFPISFVVVAGRVPWRLQHLTATARRQIVPAVLIIMAVSMRSSLQHGLRSRRNEVRSEPASQSRRAVIVIPFGGPATLQREPGWTYSARPRCSPIPTLKLCGTRKVRNHGVDAQRRATALDTRRRSHCTPVVTPLRNAAGWPCHIGATREQTRGMAIAGLPLLGFASDKLLEEPTLSR
jgi:hypothetical protein